MHADDDGIALYAAALETGFEGVVAKRKTSVYRPGQRSPDWLKVKRTSSAEFVIGGYSKGKGERERFGSLVVGYPDDAGKLRYAANVGIGFDEERIDDLLARFAPRVVPRSPFADGCRSGRARRGSLPSSSPRSRSPSGPREGICARRCFCGCATTSIPRSIRRVGDAPAEAASVPVPRARTSARRDDEARRVLAALEQPASTLEVGGHAIRLSTLGRVYWPEEPKLGHAAITKLDLIRYLVRMAPLILPHVRDRPLTLFRWPAGIRGRRMLQKHPESALPEFVETATIFSESKDADDAYLLCNNLATLVWLAEMGVLEIHVWHSRVRADDAPRARAPSSGSAANRASSAVNFPDYMLFDLDPYIYSGSERSGGEPEPNARGFDQARRVAFWLKDVLDGMSLQSRTRRPPARRGCMSSCRSRRRLRYDVVRKIARAICEHLLARHPEAITTEWDMRKRKGKVFMDFNMNVRGKSTIAPYCPRGLPGAPVSMPLAWRELATARPMQFTIGTLATARKRSDAWSGVLDRKQSLEGTLATTP